MNKEHVKKILSLSISAKQYKTLLSKKLEIDILLRFAGTTQISEAIKNLGITQYQNFLLISIGKNQSLDKLQKRILPNLINPFCNNNSKTLENYFNISKKKY